MGPKRRTVQKSTRPKKVGIKPQSGSNEATAETSFENANPPTIDDDSDEDPIQLEEPLYSSVVPGKLKIEDEDGVGL
jgi:hypothetical protein